MRTQVSQRTVQARELRKLANPAERILWTILRARRLGGYKFVRQMPLGPYFADFVCRTCGVVIEVDEVQLSEQTREDRARDEFMLAAGYSVFHVPAATVLNDQKSVESSILAVLQDRLQDFVEAHHTDPLN